MAVTDTLEAPRTKGPIVWMGMDQTELDNAYDQAVYAPNQPLVHARRNAATARAKARLGAPQRFQYGASEIESVDVYRCKRDNAPINVYVHGGAWRNGRSADFAVLAEMIVNAGAHSVIVDFNNIDDVGGNLMTMAKQVRSAVAWVYAVNSIIAVVLGYPVPRLAERRLGAPRALIVGVLATAAGLMLIGFSRDTTSLLLAVVVYSMGLVLARPSEQTVAAGLANPVALGSYFGVAALAVAIGGGLGSYAGGVLYDLGTRHGLPSLPWLVFAMIGLVAAGGLWWTLLRSDATTVRGAFSLKGDRVNG